MGLCVRRAAGGAPYVAADSVQGGRPSQGLVSPAGTQLDSSTRTPVDTLDTRQSHSHLGLGFLMILSHPGVL